MTGLAEHLKTATHEAHRHAETRPLVRDLLQGHLEREAYVLLLRGLREIYAALEEGFDRAGTTSPHLTRFAAPELRRTTALESDLAFLYGPHWAEGVEVANAAAAYAMRLRHTGEADPILLVAHAYVRYLGDLSGGRAMGRQVARHYALEGPDGLRFYDFADIPDADAWKHAYRGWLDQLSTEGRDGDLVDEAREAFAWNQRLFDDVHALR